MDFVKYFEQNKYVHVPNLVGPEITNFLYNYYIICDCIYQALAYIGVIVFAVLTVFAAGSILKKNQVL